MPFHPLVVAAVMAFGAASPTEAPSPTSVTPTPACEVTQAKYARYTRAVYREREEISSRARQRIDRMRRCAKSEEAERNMVILRRREAREREQRKETPFRFAMASWYGPGLLGNHLGCGGTLTAGTLGVAHKALACGTLIDVCARRCLSVRVVDRGPYVAGREVDLTMATAAAIGFSGVGAIRLRVTPSV
jgi:rare lipoprotein A (peptidoglycan hydrolase)